MFVNTNKVKATESIVTLNDKGFGMGNGNKNEERDLN